jgi:hypothetical protein
MWFTSDPFFWHKKQEDIEVLSWEIFEIQSVDFTVDSKQDGFHYHNYMVISGGHLVMPYMVVCSTDT